MVIAVSEMRPHFGIESEQKESMRSLFAWVLISDRMSQNPPGLLGLKCDDMLVVEIKYPPAYATILG